MFLNHWRKMIVLHQRRMVTRARLAALIAASLLLGTACGAGDGGSASGSSPATTVAAGTSTPEIDTLTMATSFAISDVDPLANGFWAPEFGFGALLMKPLGAGKLEPWLLESMSQSSPTTWELNLRPDLKFHNGRAIDAAALADTMNYLLENNSSLTTIMAGASAAATDADTVTLTTVEPTVFVPSLLAHESMFPIFDLDAYEATASKPEGLIAARIWSGPYEVTSLDEQAMEMTPSQTWFAGPPQLSKLTLRFIPDAQARILAVRNGEVDLALYPPTSASLELAGQSDAFYLTQPAGTADAGFLFPLNVQQAPLNDVEVRRALRDAIDYEAIARDVLNGLYDPSLGLYPQSLPYALANQVTDVAAANATLDAAGWLKGSDGVRSKGGEKLSINILVYPQQPDSKTIAVAMQSQLKVVGFDVSVSQVDDVTEALKSPDGWSAAVIGNGILDWTASDPVSPLIEFFTPGAQNNYASIDDPELTSLIDELRTTFDVATRDKLLGDVQRIVVEDKVYALYVALKRVPVVVGPRIPDYVVPPVALLFVDQYA